MKERLIQEFDNGSEALTKAYLSIKDADDSMITLIDNKCKWTSTIIKKVLGINKIDFPINLIRKDQETMSKFKVYVNSICRIKSGTKKIRMERDKNYKLPKTIVILDSLKFLENNDLELLVQDIRFLMNLSNSNTYLYLIK